MLNHVLTEYEHLATNYDRRWRSYIGCSTHETLKRLPQEMGQAMRLLDVGCGTGALLEAVLGSFPWVKATGVDPSPAMLRVARRRLPEHVQLVEGFAERLPLNTEQFDVVVSCSALHYFDRPDRALAEMKRVLKPSGHLIVTDWCDDYLLCKLCGFALRVMRKSHKKIYGTRECTRMLTEATFRNAVIERYKIDWLWGLMTVRATG